MTREELKATHRTNAILSECNSKEYDLSLVFIKPLYEALKAFYAANKTAVGHTITHNAGTLYIDGKRIVNFATSRDTLNKRLARCTEESYRAEGRILKKQEEFLYD